MYNNSIGVIYSLSELLEHGPDKLFDLEIDCVQLNAWNTELYTEKNAGAVKKMLKDKIRISSFWVGWSGPTVWNSIDGPHTLGIVPPAFRHQRMNELLKGVDFAHMLETENMATHVGFIPEHPSFPKYRGVVQTVKHIAAYCKIKGIYFNFETGQETPVTLMRCIKDIGLDNLGINLDPANLILYGRGNPIDSLDVFGQYVRCIHAKDGLYPTNGRELGHEVRVGTGKVNFPDFIKKLRDIGFTGDFIIEREISGEQQRLDIAQTVNDLKQWLT